MACHSLLNLQRCCANHRAFVWVGGCGCVSVYQTPTQAESLLRGSVLTALMGSNALELHRLAAELEVQIGDAAAGSHDLDM